jgi:hypothetical protein
MEVPRDVWYAIMLNTECVLSLRATCRCSLETSKLVPLRFENGSREASFLMSNSTVPLNEHVLNGRPAPFFLYGLHLSGDGSVEERSSLNPIWDVSRACSLSVVAPHLTSFSCRHEIEHLYLKLLGKGTFDINWQLKGCYKTPSTWSPSL